MSTPQTQVGQQKITDDNRKEFYKALLLLHSDIEAMKKTTGNTFFKNHKYIPLPEMIGALKPIFQKHSFILSQPVDVAPLQTNLVNCVFSTIVHAPTGLSDSAKLAIPHFDDMQKLGGAITYARRYTLSALLGLEEIDDDGNLASGKGKVSTSASVQGRDNF